MNKIKRKSVLFIFLLISQIFQLCAMNDTGSNPGNGKLEDIHKVIRARDIDTIKTLIEKNPYLVNQKEYNSCNTPLHTAIETQSFDIIKLLIDNGANVNITRSRAMSPLHHLAFIESNNPFFSTQTCKLLIENEALVNAKNVEGKTALHLAASKTNIGLVKTLLECGADKTIKDKYNKTALNCAKKNSDIINILNEKDIAYEINNTENSNNNKQSPQKRARNEEFLPTTGTHKIQKIEPLQEFNTFGEININEKDEPIKSFKFLINHSALDNKRRMALTFSSFNKNAISSSHYQNNNNNNNNLTTIDNSNITNITGHNNTNAISTPQESSSIINSHERVQNFPQYKIKTDEFGHTALYLAVAQQDEQLVRQLLNCGINTQVKQDIIMTANRFNNTTLHATAANGNLNITKTLLNSFTNQAEKQKFVMMQDQFGNTALHLAVGENSLNIVHEILHCFKDLATKQEFVLIKNKAGKTALDIFRGCEHKETINFLEKILEIKINNNNNNYDYEKLFK